MKYVQNFTDIDDKILKRAKEERSSMKVSEKNIIEFHKDMDSLGIMRPDSMPRATNHICNICSFITILEDKGYAYSRDGDVYYSVFKNKNYGKLSNQNIQEQKYQSARKNANDVSKKLNPQDFALWEKAKDDEPFFDSPWGKGRPGWHIECSAMVKDELGDTIDIHLGGSDLIFRIMRMKSPNQKQPMEKVKNYWPMEWSMLMDKR